MPGKNPMIPRTIIAKLKTKSYVPKPGNNHGTIQADWDVIQAILSDRAIMAEVLAYYVAAR